MLPFILLAIVILLVIVFKLPRKKVRKLQAGDYVMLKSKYKVNFPNVPTMFALKIEAIEAEKAMVVFIHSNNQQVCKETIPVYALSKAV